jgi:hypothetical protein
LYECYEFGRPFREAQVEVRGSAVRQKTKVEVREATKGKGEKKMSKETKREKQRQKREMD